MGREGGTEGGTVRGTRKLSRVVSTASLFITVRVSWMYKGVITYQTVSFAYSRLLCTNFTSMQLSCKGREGYDNYQNKISSVRMVGLRVIIFLPVLKLLTCPYIIFSIIKMMMVLEIIT